MSDRIILASGSEIRKTLLNNAGVNPEIIPGRIDEEAVISSMQEAGAKPRDVADILAEQKARKVSQKHLDAWVIGCDQVLDLEGRILQKSQSKNEAQVLLREMAGKKHTLLSAAVIFHEGKPVWRHVGVARMHMREISIDYIERYVERNWDSIQYCVGCYELEAEGVRLFSRVEGDYFTVLGLPLIELLGYLTLRGVIDG